ncbi:hypothetical protein FPV67DRAFT_1676189 [Lyophyllum atratum]|nr:hypothetical protein FPV67DRAFT_1676189 [Lyophyllum atratum]
MINARLSIPVGRPLGGTFKASAQQWTRDSLNDDNDRTHTHLYNALNTPWQPFTLCMPQESRPVVSHKRVLGDLAQLGNSTTAVGKPQRIWPLPKYGVIGDHRIGAEVGWPPRAPAPSFCRIPSFPGPIPSSGENNTTLIAAAPIPIVRAFEPVRAAFEVRAYAATMPEVILTPLSAVFDHDAADENKAPAMACLLENEDEDSENDHEIPEPHMRGERKPLGVLHYDEAASPPSNRVLVPETVQCSSPAISETGSEGSVGSAKGWARLRAKAPPAIQTGVKAKNEGSGGSMVGEEVKGVAGKREAGSGSRSKAEAAARAPLALVVSTSPTTHVARKVPILPVTPGRVSFPLQKHQ